MSRALLAIALLCSCATVQPVVTKLEDCAKPVVQNSVNKIIPIVELILSTAAEGDWQDLLGRIASMWTADGWASCCAP